MKSKHYTPSRTTKKAVIWTASISLFVVLIAIWVTAAIMTNIAQPDDEAAAEVTVEETVRSVTGNTPAEDRAAVLDVATTILNEAAIADETEFMETLEALDTAEQLTDHVAEDLVEHFRFEDTFQEVPMRQNNAVQALISIASFIPLEDGDINPVMPDAADRVHLDPTVGVAYVPLEIYMGTQTGYSLMLVYVDDSWQLDPYNLLDSVTAAAISQGNSVPTEQE